MKKYKHKSNKKQTERVGFYIALSICLVAVGLAVWSAYTSLSDYLNDTDDTDYYSALIETASPVAQVVTGVTEPETTPATVDQTPTQAETRNRTGALYETSTLPRTEDAAATSQLNPLQAVLKITDNLIYPAKSKQVYREYSESAVYSKTMQDYRAHTGCDFTTKAGEDIYSMCDGVVKDISFDEHYGVIVEVASSDYSVFYCGVDSKTAVKMNDQIKQGDVVGQVSQIPCESADASHIHIEIKVGNKLIDPMTVISNDE